MNHLSLFSGIGGFDLAAEWMGWNNIAHTEINPYCRSILNAKWPNANSHENITTTDYSIYRDRIGIVTGGFPCQDASKAKQHGDGQQGLRGARTGLFWDMCRAIEEIKPKWVVAENVANILKTNRGGDFTSILTELSRLGYNAEWRVCRASEVGAPHHRARLYIVAYPNSIRIESGQTFFSNVREKTSQVAWRAFGATVQTFRGGRWLSEPPTVCLDDGLSERLGYKGKARREALKAYGNAVTPQIPYKIFQAIDQYEKEHSNQR